MRLTGAKGDGLGDGIRVIERACSRAQSGSLDARFHTFFDPRTTSFVFDCVLSLGPVPFSSLTWRFSVSAWNMRACFALLALALALGVQASGSKNVTLRATPCPGTESMQEFTIVLGQLVEKSTSTPF